MEQQATLYYYIYQDLITQMYTGQLAHGDELPSLAELCAQYTVGRNTMRNALQLLSENAYIDILHGKKARVMFDYNDPHYKDPYKNELLHRTDAILDIYDTMALVMPDLAISCLSQASPAQHAELLVTLRAIEHSIFNVTQQELYRSLLNFYTTVNAISNNPLQLHLFRSMFRFVQTPLAASSQHASSYRAGLLMIKTVLKTLEYCVSHHKNELLRNEIRMFAQLVRTQTASYLKRISAELPACTPAPVQIPFTWYYAPGQDYLYYNVVFSLIDKITHGIYPLGTTLPSYLFLSQQYGVSEKTSRKAIAVLRELQIVITAPGKSTRIAQIPALDKTMFLENEFLHTTVFTFYHAMHLFTSICRVVVLRAVPLLCQEQITAIIGQLQSCQAQNHKMLPALESLTDLFFTASPSPSMQMIYAELKQAMGGGIFIEYCSIDEEMVPDTDWRLMQLITYLRQGNIAAVADSFTDIYVNLFGYAKRFADSIGLNIELTLANSDISCKIEEAT
ncbi:MAG: GntR family transcriptional regulator [Lachnospiraceae bacterium]